jgi:malate dehydrogenase
VGQALALLLKSGQVVESLAIYDIHNSHGVAVDLGHINTNTVVEGFLPQENGLERALKGGDFIYVVSGVPLRVNTFLGIRKLILAGRDESRRFCFVYS